MDTLHQFFHSFIDITKSRIMEASDLLLKGMIKWMPDIKVLENSLAHYSLIATKSYYHCAIAIKKSTIVLMIAAFWKDAEEYFRIFFNIPKEKPLQFQNSTHYLYDIQNTYYYEEVTKDAVDTEIQLSDKEKQYLLTINYMDSLKIRLENKEVLDAIVVIHDNEEKRRKTYVYICNDIKNNPDINKLPSNTKFLYIEYRNNETGENVEIHLEPDYYISGNQLFSPTFVYEMLQKRGQQSKIEMN